MNINLRCTLLQQPFLLFTHTMMGSFTFWRVILELLVSQSAADESSRGADVGAFPCEPMLADNIQSNNLIIGG